MLLNSFFISCVHSICSFTRLCSFFSFCLFCSSSLYWYSVFSRLIYSPCSLICCSILFDSDRIWSSRSTNVFFVFKCDLRSSSSYLPLLINTYLKYRMNFPGLGTLIWSQSVLFFSFKVLSPFTGLSVSVTSADSRLADRNSLKALTAFTRAQK